MNYPPEAYAAVERQLRRQLAEHSDALLAIRSILLRMSVLDCEDSGQASATLDLIDDAGINQPTAEVDARDCAAAKREVELMLQDADADEGDDVDMRAEHGTYFTASGVRAA